MLHIDDLVVRYGTAIALDGVSLDVGAGEMVALVGPNGAGKSTLINTVSGLLDAGVGPVVCDGTGRPGPRGPADVPRHDASRTTCASAAGRSATEHLDEVFDLLPDLVQLRRAQGRAALRRPAADGGGRPGADGQARPAGDRRAVARAGPDRRRRARRAPALPQPGARHRRPARGAGGDPRLRRVPPRLRARGRAGRRRRAERRAGQERGGAQGLLRRPRGRRADDPHPDRSPTEAHR